MHQELHFSHGFVAGEWWWMIFPVHLKSDSLSLQAMLGTGWAAPHIVSGNPLPPKCLPNCHLCCLKFHL